MTNPSWDDLENKTPTAELPHEHIKNVMARIGETPDGKLLAEYLRKTRIYASPPRGLEDSALREIEAERRVAVEFTRLLEQPIVQNERRRSKSRDTTE